MLVVLKNNYFLIVVFSKKVTCTLLMQKKMYVLSEPITFKNDNIYIPDFNFFRSETGFNGTNVNQALSSWQEG